MMDVDTACQILGVSCNDSYETMRRAFKHVALRNHPDKCSDDPEATRTFQRINAAWEILRHEQQSPRGCGAWRPARTYWSDAAAADQHAATQRAKDALERLRREQRRQQEEVHQRTQQRSQPSSNWHAPEPTRDAPNTDAVTEVQRMALRAKMALEQLRRRMQQEQEQCLGQERPEHPHGSHRSHRAFDGALDGADESASAHSPSATDAGGAADGHGEDDPLDVQRHASTRAKLALEQLQISTAALALQCAARRWLARRAVGVFRGLWERGACLKCPVCLETKAADALELTACSHRFCQGRHAGRLAGWAEPQMTVGQAQATCRTEVPQAAKEASMEAAKHAEETSSEASTEEDEDETDEDETDETEEDENEDEDADEDAGNSDWEDAREYVSDDEEEPSLEPEEPRPSTKVLLEEAGEEAVEAAAPVRAQVSIIAKLHQHGYEREMAAAAMFELELPALDWTELDLRRAVAHLDLQCLQVGTE